MSWGDYVHSSDRTTRLAHCQISRYLLQCMNREKTDFLTCGPWSGGTSVTLRLLEWAAGRWCHAAEELLGCRSFRAA